MRFATDENFDRRILDGLRIRLPELDIIRVQDTEMYQLSDPELLGKLAFQGRILLTHDISTMPGFVYERIKNGQSVPGVVAVPQTMPVGQALDDLELMIGAGQPADFENQVKYIPLH